MNISQALEAENLDEVKRCIAAGAPIGGDKRTPLILALEKGDFEFAEQLMARGEKLDFRGYQFTYLVQAAGESIHLMSYLLDRGLDPNEVIRWGVEDQSFVWKETLEPICRLLISRGARIAEREAGAFDQLLHEEGSSDASELLMRLGCPADLPNVHNRTMMHYWAEHGRADLLRCTLELGANPDVRNHDGATPLHYAGIHEATIEVLVNFGADVNARTLGGETPFGQVCLSNCSTEKKLRLAKLFVSAGADPFVRQSPREQSTILEKLMKPPWFDGPWPEGHEQFVEYFSSLVKNSKTREKTGGQESFKPRDPAASAVSPAEENSGGGTGEAKLSELERALKTSKLLRAAELLDQGALFDSNDQYLASLLHAAEETPEAIAFLLDHGLDPNRPILGMPSVTYYVGAHEGRAETAKWLRNYRAVMDLLVRRGGRICARHNRRSLVHVHLNHPAICQTLVRLGCPGDLLDDGGETALHRLALSGDMDTLKLMLELKSCPEARNAAGDTPLMVAAERGPVKAVETLINYRVSGVARDAGWRTPLFRVCLARQSFETKKEKIRLLMAYKWGGKADDKQGWDKFTIMDYLTSNPAKHEPEGHANFVKFFSRYLK